jgi:hypothetical protein
MAMAALRFFIILTPLGFLFLIFYFITLIGKTKPPVPVAQGKDFFLLRDYDGTDRDALPEQNQPLFI